MKDKILVTGGSGTLGSSIIRSKLFKNLNYPSKSTLNILKKKQIKNYLIKNNINLIIHCAAVARVSECENNKVKAKKINIIGTRNIIESILEIKKIKKKIIKLIFISSDAVYRSSKGCYKENSKLSPYNYYGYTKLEGEKLVKKMNEFIIIRTRFFNKNKIPFKYSATNIFTSGIEVQKLVKYIAKLIKLNFKGIINIGGKRISDYNKYKKYKNKLKPCDKSRIFEKLNFKIATDASMNIDKLKKIL